MATVGHSGLQLLSPSLGLAHEYQWVHVCVRARARPRAVIVCGAVGLGLTLAARW